MKILLTNDDGISAEGIQKLGRELSKVATLYVAAPEIEQSTIGHALTLHKPVRAMATRFKGAKKAWKITGTPSDCVKLAIRVLVPEKIDLEISGINRGPNLGTDVLYSGTVAAAMEGTILGIPSIAVSYGKTKGKLNYTPGARFIANLATKIGRFHLPKGNLLNVNIPPHERFRGTLMTRLGVRRYEDNFTPRFDPVGNPYYWLQSEISTEGKKDQASDIDAFAVERGFVSITPIHQDLTNYTILKRLKRLRIG